MTQPELTGYENEPDEHFLPLPEALYSSLFHLLGRDSSAECSWYREILDKHSCKTILECGCGTGRVSEYLQRAGLSLVGIDNSREMLDFANQSRRVPTCEMDMTRLGFRPVFDAVVLPCNTLNLLQDEAVINRCLDEIGRVLKPLGLLVLHLFVADRSVVEMAGQKRFQFDILELPDGGKLIRETLRTYHPDTHLLTLEERYKLRHSAQFGRRANYTRTFTLTAFSPARWRTILEEADFSIISSHTRFEQTPSTGQRGSTLLLVARTSEPR